jgi:hypothetical protein
MTPSAPSQVLALADSNGWQSCVEKTRAERGEDGQFFTPPLIARCLAGWFTPEGFNSPTLHLLDPGAGGGVLTAAIVERILVLRASGVLPELKEVTLEVWELDEAFLPALRQNLATCAEALQQAEIRTTLQLHHGSYIEEATRALDLGLLLDPADFPSGLLGIENHINFFHRKRAGLSAPLARGLSRFLNSTVADRYFRQFNGHTQVNASDLRSFRYPNISSLERFGKASLDDTQQTAIDLAMTEHLGAPSFTDS